MFFWNTHAGFVVLILIAAVPNGFLDLSVPLALLFHVSAEAFVPSAVIGKLLRPYVVISLLSVAQAFTGDATASIGGSVVRGLLQVQQRIAAGGGSGGVAEPSSTLMMVFWSAVVAAVGFFAVSNLAARGDDDDNDLLLLEDEEN